MGANKIGSYIVHYRSRRKEAAEQEKQRRIEVEKNRPAVVDPSFELFGYKSPSSDQLYEDPFKNDIGMTPPPSTSDDWLFQPRGASTMPHSYQFESYCEVTPKTSVSSTNSAASDAPRHAEYDMGWESSTTARPRPQSYLPSSASASYSLSMTDLHRGTEYRSRRHSNQPPGHQQQESPPLYDRKNETRANYKLEASLTRPFSVSDPLEFLSEPVSDSHLYNQGLNYSSPTISQEDERLATITEHDDANNTHYHDDLIKKGYRM